MSERPWGRAFVWLLFLGPFFFLTYNFTNSLASQRAYVPVVMFSWERHIPLIPWTIVPYWSTDLFYALSLAVCRTRWEVDSQGKRLLAIQVFATACFLAFPLRCTFGQPELSGWESQWFARLHAFDLPFNQAPSLHVGLAVVLWARFREHLRGPIRYVLAGWLLLTSVSTLTTHQHQFIDLPTGAWAGLLVVAALPDRRRVRAERKLTVFYLAGAGVCVGAAFLFQGFGWILLWPGFALSMAAAAYWTGDAGWLRMGLPMLPYTMAAWVNSRCWTRGETARCHVAGGVWIGRAPLPWEREGIRSIVELAPELHAGGDAHIGVLDLTAPTEEQLSEAVQAIQKLERPTLVCCALGYSRSALAVAAWLIAEGHAGSAEEAIAQVRRARPQIVVSERRGKRLNEWMMNQHNNADSRSGLV